MTFKFKDYATLKQEFAAQVVALRGDHQAATIDDLRKVRQSQVKLLNTVLNILDDQKVSGDTKAKLFTGFVLGIMAQIERSYKWVNPERSFFYRSLKAVVGYNDDNILDHATHAAVLTSAANLITKSTHVDQKLGSAKLAVHPFTAVETDKKDPFNLTALFTECTTMAAEHNIKAKTGADSKLVEAQAKIAAEEAAAKKAAAAEAAGPGFFSRFLGSKSTQPSAAPAEAPAP